VNAVEDIIETLNEQRAITEICQLLHSALEYAV